jgi:hypothetical protein
MIDDSDALVEEPEPPPTEVPPPRYLSRYVTYYCREIRPHPANETKGVIRQIQRLLAKGEITLEMIETALRNYRNDPFRQQSDPRLRKHIRTFFAEPNIKVWQTPVRTTRIKPVEPAIDRLGRLE